MKTDYKFWYIRRDDNGFITEATVRFYEGDIQTVSKLDAATNTVIPSLEYVRSKKLKAADLKHLGNGFKVEPNGDDAKVYYASDFGAIKTDDELRSFLNAEIFKDKNRLAIDIQKVK